MAVFKKIEKGENKTFVVFGGYTYTEDTFNITNDEARISICDPNNKRIGDIYGFGCVTITDNMDLLESYKDEIVDCFGEAEHEDDHTAIETCIIISNVTDDILVRLEIDGDGGNIVPDDVDLDFNKYMRWQKLEGYDEDSEFYPFLVLPEGTIIEDIKAFNEISIDKIIKRFNSLQRKSKIDKTLDIDRNKLRRMTNELIEEVDEGLYKYGVYSFFDNMSTSDFVNMYNIKNLKKNELIEFLKSVYDIDTSQQESKIFKKEGQKLVEKIGNDIIHTLDDREDFDEILEADSRFEY